MAAEVSPILGAPTSPPVRSDRVLSVVLARLPALLADAVTTFAVPVLVYTTTGNASDSGLAMLVQWLPRVLLIPFIGLFVDRFDARRQLVVSDLTRALLCLAPVVDPSIPVCVATACLLMLVDSHGTIATENIFATKVEALAVASAQSGLQAGTQLTRAGGPAVAGLLLGFGRARGTFLVCALVFASGAILTQRAIPGGRVAVTTPANGPASVFRSLRVGARTCLGTPELRGLLGYALLVNLFSGTVAALLAPIVIGRYHLSENEFGTLIGGALAVSILVATLLGFALKRRPSLRLWLIFLPVVAGSAVGLCVAPTVAFFAAAYGAWGLGITVFNVWFRSRRLRLLPPGEVGQTLGFFVAAMLAAVPLSALAVAVLAPVVEPPTILRGAAVVCAASCVPVLVRRGSRLFRARVSSLSSKGRIAR